MEHGIIQYGSMEAFEELNSESACLLDIREDYLHSYKQFKVPRSLYIALEDLKDRASSLPHDVMYICADSAGIHSMDAATILIDAGFPKAGNLAGGIVDWEKSGLPVIIDPEQELSGSCTCQLKRRNIK
ncbi:MAG TPA: rhodanese-like domain-containing protein [Lentimicrobium sp.]|nr:rhodanese-like domain-containing protein [Lentimicrobium sp.]